MSGERAADCGFLIHTGADFPVLAFHGTRSEQESLVNAILTGFNQECRCHPAADHFGNVRESTEDSRLTVTAPSPTSCHAPTA